MAVDQVLTERYGHEFDTPISSLAHLNRLLYFERGVSKAELLKILRRGERLHLWRIKRGDNSPSRQRELASFREAIAEINNLPDDGGDHA